MLAQSVVQILTEAALLVFADGEHFFMAPPKRGLTCGELLLGRSEPPSLAHSGQSAPDYFGDELEEVHVFDQVIQRAALHHVHGHAFVALARDDNERDGAMNLGQMVHQFLAFDVLKFQIQQHQLSAVSRQPQDGLFAGVDGGGGKSLAPQCLLDEARQPLVIIDDQHRRG